MYNNYLFIVLYDEAKPALNDNDDMIANASYEATTTRRTESKTKCSQCDVTLYHELYK